MRDMRNRFWIALGFSLPIFALSPMGMDFIKITPPFGLRLDLVLFLLASASILYPVWPFVVAAYRAEVKALVDAGATYIQFDDTSIAFLCDPMHRETVRRWGSNADELLRSYAGRMNEVLAGIPEHVTVTFHQCRGNREGHWMAEGGYDPVADVLFNAIDVHGYFLEYDTARAGGFAPLRLLPKGKVAVLGIMSSKTSELEPADDLKRRIGEAEKFAPLDQLAISPQCGFSSSIGGNPLTEGDQERKLARLVEVARAVWPG